MESELALPSNRSSLGASWTPDPSLLQMEPNYPSTLSLLHRWLQAPQISPRNQEAGSRNWGCAGEEVGDTIIQAAPMHLAPPLALPMPCLAKSWTKKPSQQRRKAPSLCFHFSKAETPPSLVPPSTGSHSPRIPQEQCWQLS